jgi:L-ascorbate metabolism protein UlaG (beta-lactamase superfamily)
VTTSIRFLGASGFELVGPSYRILMEPFLRHNPVAPYTPETVPAPDLILVSHAAWDHMGDAGEIAKRTGAPVVCPADVAEKLYEEGLPVEQVRPSIWGVCYAFGDIVVRPVECHHWTSATLAAGQRLAGVPLSFIVDTEPGVRIYHFGDTCLFPGMRMIGELYRPTVGLLGMAQTEGLPDPGAGRILTGEMNPDEAALAAEWLGVRHAVATHYMEPGPETDEFRLRVPIHDTTGGRIVHAPRAGDVITIEPEDVALPSLAWGRTSATWDHSHRPPMADGPVPGETS